jgi:hypothetical protein
MPSAASPIRDLVFISVVCLLFFAAIGCADKGVYEVRWTLTENQDFQAGDCGKHGVSGISITGSIGAGGKDVIAIPCAPGSFKREVPVGDWILVLNGLDADGHPKDPSETLLTGTATAHVVTDQLASAQPAAVFLKPQAECGDGVDNDGDGRVDLDDPSCAGRADGPKECDAATDPADAHLARPCI